MSRIGVGVTITPAYIAQGQIVPAGMVALASGTGSLTAEGLYVEFDTTQIPDTRTLTQAMNSVLNYLQTSGSIVD
jgi:hypothetical protein